MTKKKYIILIQNTAEYEVEAGSEAEALAIFDRYGPTLWECLEEYGEFSVKVVSANEDEDEWAPERGSILPKDY